MNRNTSIYPEDIEDCTVNPRLSERRTAIKPLPLKQVESKSCTFCNRCCNISTCVICKKNVCDLCIENNICIICLRCDHKQGEIIEYFKKHRNNRRKWCCPW